MNVLPCAFQIAISWGSLEEIFFLFFEHNGLSARSGSFSLSFGFELPFTLGSAALLIFYFKQKLPAVLWAGAAVMLFEVSVIVACVPRFFEIHNPFADNIYYYMTFFGRPVILLLCPKVIANFIYVDL